MKTYWKYLQLDSKGNIISNYDRSKWKIGKWRETKKTAKNCENGFHSSKEIYQAYSYVAGEVLAKVEVDGQFDEGTDKLSFQRMRIVKAYKWDKTTSVKLAIYAAEQVISIYEKEYPDDKRPRRAIQAAKKYLKNPTAARAAYAADAAAYAADAADAAAMIKKINTYMLRQVKNLEEIK